MAVHGDEETCPAVAANGENAAYSGPSVNCPHSGPGETADLSFLRRETAAGDPELPFQFVEYHLGFRQVSSRSERCE